MTTPSTSAIAMIGIGKRYPGVVALDGVDLDIMPGEVHALLGENGAGKSTLIKILTGVEIADEGQFLRGGAPVGIGSPKDAAAQGIVLVPQDILLVPHLSIGRNILLGLEGPLARRNRLSAAERDKVSTALATVGAHFDPETPAAGLSVPHRRLAQIARALLQSGDIMVFDEPTAVLSEPDADHLLEQIDSLRSAGKAILYVTHRLSEVMRLADRITVLRDGRRVGVYPKGAVDRTDLVRLMAKETARDHAPAEAVAAATTIDAPPLLRATNLSMNERFSDVTLSVAPGQVVGIAGVQGSGHGHLLRAIAGVDRPHAGEVLLDGVALRPGDVRAAVRRGLMVVPADRRGAAIVPQRALRENLALSGRVRAAARRFGLRWHRLERAMMQDYIAMMDIRPAAPETQIAALSGGNQQKVALARALEGQARVLLIEEPTQGVDVAAKAEIHRLLRRLAAERGCAVLIATSEFEELLGLADEIHVMRSGRITRTLARDEASYGAILEHALH